MNRLTDSLGVGSGSLHERSKTSSSFDSKFMNRLAQSPRTPQERKKSRTSYNHLNNNNFNSDNSNSNFYPSTPQNQKITLSVHRRRKVATSPDRKRGHMRSVSDTAAIFDEFRSDNTSQISSAVKPIYSDRYIPSRSDSNFENLNFSSPKFNSSESDVKDDSMYSALLRKELLSNRMDRTDVPMSSPSKTKNRTFIYQSPRKRVSLSDSFGSSPSKSLEEHKLLITPNKKVQRKIPRFPFKVLDAPSLKDDFYLNLVDWSSQNTLAVGLGNTVYIWSASTGQVSEICDLKEEEVTSVSWSNRGKHVAVGSKEGHIRVYDGIKLKMIRKIEAHPNNRIGTLAWNSSLLASGSRDHHVHVRDMRSNSSDEKVFDSGRIFSHKQEVCGLKWSFDDNHLASGGNDNQLLIWNLKSSGPVAKFTDHTAAVKAISWSPHQHGIICSGGGTADRHIRFWNIVSGQSVNAIDTGSQVCNLLWSKNANEIVSTHGYSLNQIIVWKYPSMQKLATLTGHTYRVLYLAGSPDGQSIVTGAGDETLRFWNVFPSSKSSLLPSKIGSNLQFPNSSSIR